MIDKILISYIISINAISFMLYGIDKFKAKFNFFRIKEKTLVFISISGGCYGGILAMLMFRHKVRKLKFIIVNALMIVVWSYLLVYLIS